MPRRSKNPLEDVLGAEQAGAVLAEQIIANQNRRIGAGPGGNIILNAIQRKREETRNSKDILFEEFGDSLIDIFSGRDPEKAQRLTQMIAEQNFPKGAALAQALSKRIAETQDKEFEREQKRQDALAQRQGVEAAQQTLAGKDPFKAQSGDPRAQVRQIRQNIADAPNDPRGGKDVSDLNITLQGQAEQELLLQNENFVTAYNNFLVAQQSTQATTAQLKNQGDFRRAGRRFFAGQLQFLNTVPDETAFLTMKKFIISQLESKDPNSPYGNLSKDEKNYAKVLLSQLTFKNKFSDTQLAGILRSMGIDDASQSLQAIEEAKAREKASKKDEKTPKTFDPNEVGEGVLD